MIQLLVSIVAIKLYIAQQ